MLDKDQGRYNIGGGSLAKYRNGKYILATYRESNLVVEKAISMLGWRPDNYYHFTFEIISRLTFADQFEELPANVTLAPRTYGIPSTYQLALAGEKRPAVKEIDPFVPHYLRITEAEANWQKLHPGITRKNYVREV